MPLPPALAAKLAKRGIINLPKEPAPIIGTESDPATLAEEEIIAEDYDDTPQQPDGYIRISADTFDQFQGYSGCPNKWNVYHECTPACRDQWREVKIVEKDYDVRREKTLSKYPLPEHWREILDIGIGRYYYWNTETDLVAWLPPGHPRCQVSRSAATLRRQMITERNSRVKEELDVKSDGQPQLPPQKESDNEDDDDDDEESEDENDEVDDSEEENDEKTSGDSKKREGSVDGDEMSNKSNESSDSDSDSMDHRDHSERRDKHERSRDKERPRGRERDRDRERRAKRHSGKEELDPMDPASYGECQRGTWASGLPQRNEARTGADVTASGSLFQMRPYPSPGAVLRANASVQGPNIGPKKT